MLPEPAAAVVNMNPAIIAMTASTVCALKRFAVCSTGIAARRPVAVGAPQFGQLAAWSETWWLHSTQLINAIVLLLWNLPR